ncbi:cytochrome P450 [Mycena capillaripes]|nr:cytochrome P450 [Mycena capillaripes]
MMLLAVLLVGIAFISGTWLLWETKSRRKLPPGPWCLPLIGNVHQLPKLQLWKTFSEWANIYGDVVYFRIASRHFIVLNTAQCASELLIKRSAIYSDRPTFTMAGQLIGRETAGGETALIFSRYGPRLRKCRRFLHESLNSQASSNYHGQLNDELCGTHSDSHCIRFIYGRRRRTAHQSST